MVVSIWVSLVSFPFLKANPYRVFLNFFFYFCCFSVLSSGKSPGLLDTFSRLCLPITLNNINTYHMLLLLLTVPMHSQL